MKKILIGLGIISSTMLMYAPAQAASIIPININQRLNQHGAVVINLSKDDPTMFHILERMPTCPPACPTCWTFNEPCQPVAHLPWPFFKTVVIKDESRQSDKLIIKDHHDAWESEVATIEFKVDHEFYTKLIEQIRHRGKDLQIAFNISDLKLVFSYIDDGFASTDNFTYSIKGWPELRR